MIFYTILGATLVVFYLAIFFYKKRLTRLRDNTDFTTVRGKALIKAYNRRLDILNGYGVFKRRPD